MRLIILGGFLGSGKTSILVRLADRILGFEGSDGRTKVAVIENEIGQVGIDNLYLDESSYTSKELFNGCVCCSMVTDLLECLCDLEKNEDPKWVILETTGLARPADIADNIWEYYDEDMSITSIIVADAGRWQVLSENAGELVHDQIRNSNYVLINKTDTVSEAELLKVKEDIAENTDGMQYEVSWAKDPGEVDRVCDEIINEIVSWEQ